MKELWLLQEMEIKMDLDISDIQMFCFIPSKAHKFNLIWTFLCHPLNCNDVSDT